MPNVSFKPTWGKHEKGLHSNDLDTAVREGEAFDQERTQELQTSARARNWETARKAEFQKNKRNWVKDKRQAEIAPLTSAIKSLKSAGSYDTGLTPMPGFALVKPEFQEKTESGIYLTQSDEAKMMTNTGVVLATGGKVVQLFEALESPVKPGDRVLIKKGLPGLELTIKGDYCLLLQWGDILARIEAEQ